MLWDCKREPLRGLGVNIEEGQDSSQPKELTSYLRGLYLQTPLMERGVSMSLFPIHLINYAV